MADAVAGQTPRPVWLGTVLWPKSRLRLSARQRLARAIFAVLGLFIALGVYAASVWFLRLCYQVEVVGPLLCRRLLDVVLLVLLSVLLLSNIVTAIGAFFLAKDLDLLVAAPIPPRTLFVARLAEQLLQSSWMVLAFGVPVLLAFAHVAGTPWTYLMMVLVAVPLLALPASLACVVALVLVRTLPAARARDVVVGVAFVAFVVLYVLLRVMRPEQMLNPDGFASVVTFLASFSAPSGSWLPSHWATVVLSSTFRDAAGTIDPLLPLGALWTTCGAVHVLASGLFRLTYLTAYSRSQQGRTVARLSRILAWIRRDPVPADGSIRSPGRRGARADGGRIVGLLAPKGTAREFLVKDFKLLLRDASQWSQLVLLVALVFVYLYNFRHFRQISDSGLVGPLALFVIGLALSGFVTTAVSVRFAFPLISLEGRMMWLLYSAPIPRRRILQSKLISTLPPLMLVAEVMAVASSLILGVAPSMIALSALVAGLTALAVAAMSIGIGAMVPDFRAESAAKVAASFGGLACMTLAMIVAFAIVAWAVYPAWLLHRGRTGNIVPFLWAGAGAISTTGVATWLSLRLGGRALERHEP